MADISAIGKISIHAPPRGATFPSVLHPDRRNISIHAPPRGATCPLVMPRSVTMPISIHAPPRGATWRCWEKEPTREEFQFTPLREGRHHQHPANLPVEDFNSRPSARGDAFGAVDRPAEWISIHAPPRGATFCFLHSGLSLSFQFTPLREGRLWVDKDLFRDDGFQFTPLREGRRVSLDYLVGRSDISIHAPPRGATRRERDSLKRMAISIHAPPRGATLL